MSGCCAASERRSVRRASLDIAPTSGNSPSADLVSTLCVGRPCTRASQASAALYAWCGSRPDPGEVGGDDLVGVLLELPRELVPQSFAAGLGLRAADLCAPPGGLVRIELDQA